MAPRVLVVDNYDSFTFNLVQYLGELGAAVEVFKNDAIDVAGIRARAPRGVLISPGPCTPNEAGVSLAVLAELGAELPIFGVCLGHQAIGQAYGGRVVRAGRLMHGKTSPILHDGRGLFDGLPSPFEATRYHSLLVERASLPAVLEVSAWTAEGEIMGLRHRELRVEGVQFHPESVLTHEGKRLVANWVRQLVSTAGFPELLARLLAAGQGQVDAADVRRAFDAILAGAWTPVQVGTFAVALRMRGESAEAIVSAAEAMRATMTPVDHGLPVVVDTCGTGGDGAHTLNLSSAAALIVAACGLVVAKHGNRSISSRCGSADVVEALGIPLDIPPERQHEVLREAGIAFLFAPAHHPALRHAAQARRELGTRTIFNALGPLANPARATHQLIGVYDDALRPVAARALGRLGTRRAWIVRGEDGLDEVSPCAPTRVSELREDGEVRERVVTPEDFGIAPGERSAIAGGDAPGNAQALVAILEGAAHAARDAVLLNAAAALVVATGDEPRAAVERARKAVDDGAARGALDTWRRVARRVRGE